MYSLVFYTLQYVSFLEYCSPLSYYLQRIFILESYVCILYVFILQCAVICVRDLGILQCSIIYYWYILYLRFPVVYSIFCFLLFTIFTYSPSESSSFTIRVCIYNLHTYSPLSYCIMYLFSGTLSAILCISL
jgi:hypothetical protein